RRNVLPPGPPVSLVQIHPDGRRLAVASDKTVYVRDLNDGKELAAFKHPAGVHSLAWRGDGRAFAAGCFDHDIYLWDVANSAQPLRTLKGHMGSVFYVAFSPGGEVPASDAWDATCRLWDAMTGQ